jgi:hypothetical protein
MRGEGGGGRGVLEGSQSSVLLLQQRTTPCLFWLLHPAFYGTCTCYCPLLPGVSFALSRGGEGAEAVSEVVLLWDSIH